MQQRGIASDSKGGRRPLIFERYHISCYNNLPRVFVSGGGFSRRTSRSIGDGVVKNKTQLSSPNSIT